MTITTATRIIAAAFAAGTISAEAAKSAQNDIRAKSNYGQAMTGADRARIVTVRYGIEG
jgi:hypothetical protein